VCPGEWRLLQPHHNPYGQFPGAMRAASSTAWVTDRFGNLAYAAL